MSENKLNTPKHVAIIMDGNGRWAQERGQDRSYGHMNGVESVRAAVRAAVTHGVGYLTLYAFSTENWGRPQEEVDMLMELLCKSVIQEKEELKAQGVRVETIGDVSRMSDKVQEYLQIAKDETSAGDKLTLIIALNYSSRDELVTATKALVQKVINGEISVGDIDYNSISDCFYTANIPDPDLIIRTSGECRLSNFLMNQAAYAELYFTPTLWPDFREEHFARALEEYGNRNRRFGLV